MIRYHSANERKSRLARHENARFMRQTILIIVATIGLIAAIIFFGIPLLIRAAVFLGDLRNSAQPLEQTDTIPPSAPQIITPPQATNSATLTVNGFSESGSKIDLFNNNALVSQTVVDADGNFSFSQIALDDGINRMYAIAYDEAGNASVRSSSQTIVFQSKAPTLVINLPTENQHFFGLSERTIEISGKTDPGTTVTVNEQHALVSTDGQFSTRLQLNPGNNKLTITTTDQAGNQTSKEVNVNYSE